MEAVQKPVHPFAIVALFEFFAHFIRLVQAQQMAREKLIRAGDQTGIGADADGGGCQHGSTWRGCVIVRGGQLCAQRRASAITHSNRPRRAYTGGANQRAAPRGNRQCIKALKPRRQRIDLTALRGLPCHRDVAAHCHQRAKIIAQLRLPSLWRCEFELGAQTRGEKQCIFCRCAQMGGIRTDQQHRVEVPQPRGRKRRQHHRAVDFAVAKYGGLELGGKAAAPFGRGACGSFLIQQLFAQIVD